MRSSVLPLVALAIALLAVAKANRRERAVLDMLGARRRSGAAVLAFQGLLVGFAGTLAGTVLGTVGTVFGLWRYNSHGRFADDDLLPAIPVRFPAPLAVALVALPLAAAAIGWAISIIRPVDPAGAEILSS